jgi:hypothetical protein
LARVKNGLEKSLSGVFYSTVMITSGLARANYGDSTMDFGDVFGVGQLTNLTCNGSRHRYANLKACDWGIFCYDEWVVFDPTLG